MCNLLLHIILVIFVYKKIVSNFYFSNLKKNCVCKNERFLFRKKFKFYLLQTGLKLSNVRYYFQNTHFLNINMIDYITKFNKILIEVAR